MGKAEEYDRIRALVPPEHKKKAKENTKHGELTEQIRKVVKALAEGDDVEINAEEARLTPEERYGDLSDGSRKPSDWKRRRKEVFRRDNYECRNCGQKGGMDGEAELAAHHVVPVSAGGNSFLSNLITLCEDCHYAAHHSY